LASNADLESKLISKCDQTRDLNPRDQPGRLVIDRSGDTLD